MVKNHKITRRLIQTLPFLSVVYRHASRFLPRSFFLDRTAQVVVRNPNKLIVQNTVRHFVCPFCGGDQIVSRGRVAYSGPLLFASTQIILANPVELLSCRECQSGFIQNGITETDAANFYTIKNSDRWSSTERFVERRPDQVISIIRKLLTPGMEILDVGCSNGVFLDFAAELGCKTFGLEYSEKDIAITSAKGHICGQKLEDLVGEGKYDAIFFFDVVEHVYDFNGLLDLYIPLLKDGGVLVMLTGDIESRNAVRHGSSWWYINYPEHIMFPSMKYLSALKDLDMQAVLETYALKWQDGRLLWKLKNIIQKNLKGTYDGLPSLTPDHYLAILRKKP